MKILYFLALIPLISCSSTIEKIVLNPKKKNLNMLSKSLLL
ncbi:hypothetical protein [Chryseobacterium nepalense]|nr:hypothetical protein [Chryseobacterium nepalense]